MKTQETVLIGRNGLEIIKIHVPPSPDRHEFYNMYRVEGYPHQFLSASRAWQKAAELQEHKKVSRNMHRNGVECVHGKFLHESCDACEQEQEDERSNRNE